MLHARPHSGIAMALRVGLACAILLVTALAASAQTLRIYHVDVDQGDATLVVSPSGNTLLIDSGKNGHGPRLNEAMAAAGVTDIDHFVCTHYHEDHYGGIDDLVNDYGISIEHAYDRGDKAYVGSHTSSTQTYIDYEEAVGHRARHLMRGESIPLDEGMLVTCVASGGVVLGEDDPQTGVDENDMSIALLIQFGGFRCFIGGDIQEATEEKLATHDLVLDVDLYQADHHGSETSSTVALLNDMAPAVVIISNGDRADYQHPRQSTLDRFAAMSSPPSVFQTNKYTKGGEGGNVPDSHIADLVPSGDEGLILVTVDQGAGSYEVSYQDTAFTFPVKALRASPAVVVIESILPNPIGKDRDLEEATLRNDGPGDVDLSSWLLRDERGRCWTLTAAGTLGAGQKTTICRDGMPMNLNNNGDRIELVDSVGSTRDEFSYSSSSEGVVIDTGH